MKRNTKSGTRIQEQRKEQGRNEDNRENKGRNKRNKGGKHLPHCNEGVGKSQRNKGKQDKKEIRKDEIKKGITIVQKEESTEGWMEGMKVCV